MEGKMFIKVIFNKKVLERVIEYFRKLSNEDFLTIPWETIKDCRFILRLHPEVDEGLVFYVSRDFYEEVLL